MTDKTEALRLAELLTAQYPLSGLPSDAAAMLRTQAAEIERLRAALKSVLPMAEAWASHYQREAKTAEPHPDHAGGINAARAALEKQ